MMCMSYSTCKESRAKCGHTKVYLTDSSKLALTCMYLHTYHSGMLRVSTSVLFIIIAIIINFIIAIMLLLLFRYSRMVSV